MSVTKDFTGIWDQTEQESQGFVLQIVAQPGGRKEGVAYWFTYDDSGNSQWLVGQGPVENNRDHLDFVTVSGPTFLESRNPTLSGEQPTAEEFKSRLRMVDNGRAMTWTKDKPQQPGWYWWKGGRKFLPDMVEVYRCRGGPQCRGTLRGTLPPYAVQFLDSY